MNNQAGQYKYTALYARLSSDDELQGDSNIIHQKQLLETYAAENGLGNCQFYVDDGFSGTDFDRPDFQRMINDIENQIVGTVIVKDLSRLGRNYYQVGYYTEKFFPEHDTRFISITDNVDSLNGTNEFAPFHNLINDFYAKDIAKKQKAVIESKGKSGQRLTTRAIYGYKKDENGQWIIDNETADVVKEIFRLFIDGKGVKMIANYLFANRIKTPAAYSGNIRKGDIAERNPYLWSTQTISSILSKQEYCGDTVNFRYRKQSLCSKIVIKNKSEDIKIFKNTHEAIISRDIFEKAQEIRSKRRRMVQIEKPIMFTELYCADCKSRMNIVRSRERHSASYTCSQYRKAKVIKETFCSSHYISENYLVEYVLCEINAVLKSAQDSGNFQKIINTEFSKRNSKNQSDMKKNILQAQKRFAEIDKIIKELYEDKVNGNITLELFQKLSSEYVNEQTELSQTILNYNKKCLDFDKTKNELKGFFDVVEKYRLQGFINELTPEIVEEFTDRIEISETKKADGKRQPFIYFKGIGLLSSDLLR